MAGALLTAMAAPGHAVEFELQNMDPPGAGFNDPTPAAPVGGNPGTSVGEQRILAFERAFAIWGGKLAGDATVQVAASFSGLDCGPTSGVLGAAGPNWLGRDFPRAPMADTWYSGAQINQLFDTDVNPEDPELVAFFNGDLGSSGCLEQMSWYYGFDHQEIEGQQIDFLTVLAHEMGHGLGFSSFADEASGSFYSDVPDIYGRFVYDRSAGLTWAEMTTDDERAESAVNTGNLVWSGPGVTLLADGVLEDGHGTVAQGWVRLYAPNPLQPGSSVSHFDTSADPNLLMEPAINSELMEMPLDGLDLTTIALSDMGWRLEGVDEYAGKIAAQCDGLPGRTYRKCYGGIIRSLYTEGAIDRVTAIALVRDVLGR